MTESVWRAKLRNRTAGYPTTIRLAVTQDGVRLDLTGYSILAKAKRLADGTYTTGTTSIPTQVGVAVGEYRVVFSAVQLATAYIGVWWLDVYLGVSGSEERIEKRYLFALEPKETEA